MLIHNGGEPPLGKVDDLRTAVQVLLKMEEEGFDLASQRKYDGVIVGLAAHGQVEEAL